MELHEHNNISDEDDEGVLNNYELQLLKKNLKVKVWGKNLRGKKRKTCFWVIIKKRNQYYSLKIFPTFQT